MLENSTSAATNLSVAEFRPNGLHARHMADPESYVDEEKQGVEARALTLTNTDDGVVLIHGNLAWPVWSSGG